MTVPERQFEEAKSFHQNGHWDDAERIYRYLLHQKAGWTEVVHLLAVLLGQKGRHEEATIYFLKAVELQPLAALHYLNLGRNYISLRSWDNAIRAYQMAIKLKPDYQEAWFGKANALKGKGDLAAAIKGYQKAIKYRPDYAEAFYNLGNTWLEMGHWRSAREAYETCIQIQPDHAQAHNNLASTLEYWDEYDQAEQHYQEAIRLNASFVEAQGNLAALYEKSGRTRECREIYENMHPESSRSEPGWLQWHRDQISEIIWEGNEQITAFRAKLESITRHFKARPPRLILSDLHRLQVHPPFDLAYQGLDDLPLKMAYARFFDQYFQQIRKELGTDNRRDLRNDRRKVGFVVTHGHEGVFLKCMRGMLNQLDLKKIEIIVVCQAPNGRAILEPVLRRQGLEYLLLANRLDLAARTLHEAQLDVLYFWEVGTDALNYFLPFFALAPVQCTSWGWPVTSGIPSMDYFLSCDLLETPESDAFYSEKLIRFNRLPVYYYKPPVPGVPRDRQMMDLPVDKNLYLCAQNLRKVHPDMDRLLLGILTSDPKATILFIEDKQKPITDKLRNRFRAAFPEQENRIRFLPRMKEEDYLNVLGLADVVLDTPHYTGGANTAYDAFSAGVPYVTLPTGFHRGRYGKAAYEQLGVTDLIASDAEDYVQKAVRVASDGRYRRLLQDRIFEGHNRIFEDQKAVHELQQFLETVQARYR